MKLVICLPFIVLLFVTVSSAHNIDEIKENDGYYCVCPRIYAPVCASNGRTYGNTCEFTCKKARSLENLSIVTYGRCDDPDHLQNIFKTVREHPLAPVEVYYE
ncbi:hypothetical protein NQ314_008867 [Rhamnusium bicolor]|uniref:Kazal-like domain-containing protein n=1 Tax=Rhamnusium bicolor TaxID=1586634 RepID=A0AAV8Y7I6_9CUCU|nr:hypothetical protein NQ314_008867 [Rhamnusium bicolor]